MKLTLASASPARLMLLKEIGIIPDAVVATNIDETPRPKEVGVALARRLAEQKALAAVSLSQFPTGWIIAADTVVMTGRRLLDKALTDADVRQCLMHLSGRRCHVYTGLYVIKLEEGEVVGHAARENHSILKTKRLVEEEIEAYVASGEGIGVAGGCSIRGRGGAFFPWISGSYSSIMGLPVYEIRCLLTGLGYPLDK